MPDHVHMPAGIPPRIGVPGFMGCLKGKSALLMSGKACNLKHKLRDRKFWAEGCYVSAAGMNEATIAKHIREQEAADIALGKLGVKEHEDRSAGNGPAHARLTGTPRARRPCGLNEAKARDLSPWPAFIGSCPQSRPPATRMVMIEMCFRLSELVLVP